MNRLQNWINVRFAFLSNTNFRNTMRNYFSQFIQLIDRIGMNITRLIIIGIIFNFISCFYPELPERFPTIYAWFDGWVQLGEFALRGALNCIYGVFTGNFLESWYNFNAEYNELLNQFITWISSLKF